MPRNPDALDEGPNPGGPTAQPGATEFAAGPSRAEHGQPRSIGGQPLWPWLVIVALVVAVGVIYLATQ